MYDLVVASDDEIDYEWAFIDYGYGFGAIKEADRGDTGPGYGFGNPAGDGFGADYNVMFGGVRGCSI